MRKPDFENIQLILNKEKPHRPTIFEFSINPVIFELMIPGARGNREKWAQAWAALGFDFAIYWNYLPQFPRHEHDTGRTISLNDGAMIDSWESFEKYPWPNVQTNDYSEIFDTELPAGMKIIAHGPCGLLENVIGLLGYDNLCMMIFDNPELVQAVVDKVAVILYQHYEKCLESEKVGACFVNDDWGFAQQPMISPADMRKYIVPWTAKIVNLIHDHNRQALQHSCGNAFDCGLIDDVIDVCKFDGRHSYEDSTLPVEEAYRRYHKRLAIIGGLDVDFLCRRPVDEIKQRAQNMLEMSASEGAYALGSGNSIPDYVPINNFFAMMQTATNLDYPGI
jgi:uroporphyrinogen decarboxylase